MCDKAQEKAKPHINIGTIGHIDDNGATLRAAITKKLEMEYGSNESLCFPFHRDDEKEIILTKTKK